MHRFNPVRLTKRILDGPPVDYMHTVNARLMAAGALRSPMTPEEIWTITDIHDSPGQSAGISLSEMRGWMDSYELLSARSYGFFGKLVSRVSKDMAEREARLREQKALNGRFLSAAWRKVH